MLFGAGYVRIMGVRVDSLSAFGNSFYGRHFPEIVFGGLYITCADTPVGWGGFYSKLIAFTALVFAGHV